MGTAPNGEGVRPALCKLCFPRRMGKVISGLSSFSLLAGNFCSASEPVALSSELHSCGWGCAEEASVWSSATLPGSEQRKTCLFWCLLTYFLTYISDIYPARVEVSREREGCGWRLRLSLALAIFVFLNKCCLMYYFLLRWFPEVVKIKTNKTTSHKSKQSGLFWWGAVSQNDSLWKCDS